MSKIKKNWIEPLDFLLSQPHPQCHRFVSDFMRAAGGDEDSLCDVALTTRVAYGAAKDPRNNVTPAEIAITNTFTWLTNQLAKSMFPEEQPAREPQPTAILDSEDR
jgi:hypothetical protein